MELCYWGTWCTSYHWVVDQRQTMYTLVFVLALHRGVPSASSTFLPYLEIPNTFNLCIWPFSLCMLTCCTGIFLHLGVSIGFVRSYVVLCPCCSGLLISMHLHFLDGQLGSCWGVSFRSKYKLQCCIVTCCSLFYISWTSGHHLSPL